MNNYRIDNLQYCNWSKEIFKINNEAKFPIPGIIPLTSPVRIPIIVGLIRSTMVHVSVARQDNRSQD